MVISFIFSQLDSVTYFLLYGKGGEDVTNESTSRVVTDDSNKLSFSLFVHGRCLIVLNIKVDLFISFLTVFARHILSQLDLRPKRV